MNRRSFIKRLCVSAGALISGLAFAGKVKTPDQDSYLFQTGRAFAEGHSPQRLYFSNEHPVDRWTRVAAEAMVKNIDKEIMKGFL
jgi:hypothetical protein